MRVPHAHRSGTHKSYNQSSVVLPCNGRDNFISVGLILRRRAHGTFWKSPCLKASRFQLLQSLADSSSLDGLRLGKSPRVQRAFLGGRWWAAPMAQGRLPGSPTLASTTGWLGGKHKWSFMGMGIPMRYLCLNGPRPGWGEHSPDTSF